MEKFCQYCGRQVPEGMMCNCPEAAASRAAAKQTQAAQGIGQTASQFKQLGSRGLKVFSDLVMAPASTLHGCCKPESMSTGLMAYILKAVIAGIMVAIGISSIPYYSIGFGSWMQIFLKMLLISLVSDAVFFGVTLGIGALFQNKADPASILGVLGIASFPVAVTYVVAGLLCVLSFQLALIVTAGLLCLCMVITYFALDSALRILADKKVYAMAVVFIGVLVVTWYGGKLMLGGIWP